MEFYHYKYFLENEFKNWDPDKYDWAKYSEYLARRCSKYFEKWWDADKFNWFKYSKQLKQMGFDKWDELKPEKLNDEYFKEYWEGKLYSQIENISILWHGYNIHNGEYGSPYIEVQFLFDIVIDGEEAEIVWVREYNNREFSYEAGKVTIQGRSFTSHIGSSLYKVVLDYCKIDEAEIDRIVKTLP